MNSDSSSASGSSPFPIKDAPIKVGISSCLLGQRVRYNGGHKRSALCIEELGRVFDFVPCCPETEAGLGVPRAPIRLVGDPLAPRAVRVADAGADVTAVLSSHAARRIPQLQELSGYIFIGQSPSCGLFQVKVYGDAEQPPVAAGRGIFAAALTRARPLLPVEEEGRLNDPRRRERFITRVRAWHDWHHLKRQGVDTATLLAFHTCYQNILLPLDYQALEGLLTSTGEQAPEALGERYFSALMQLLQAEHAVG